MWRQKKKYTGPRHPWQAERIEEEHKLAKEYGIRRMREIWKARAILRRWQDLAKKIIGMPAAEREKAQKILIEKLQKYGFLEEKVDIDNVLSLKLKDILERRLSTILVKKGMALTPKQARQFIIHGKVMVNGQKLNRPSYLVKPNDNIEFVPGFSPKLHVEKVEINEKAENQNG
ncbi:MAG: 30S ribosomal protein S4 [Candidatus Nanoarchaeia archaeon]